MPNLLALIRADIKANVDEKTRSTAQNYFKEPIKAYGVKTATVNKIALQHWPQARALGKAQVFKLCEELFRSGYMEEAFIAAVWLPKLAAEFEPGDLATFKSWIERYVDNWAKCDSLCNHTVGDFLDKYPECVAEVKSWARSGNRWLRRASAVSLILPARRGGFLPEVLEISTMLLSDKDDLVQKGYGWLLKEASKKHQKEVFEFIVANRKVMPRTALRYAIEKMPKALQAEAMNKE